MRSAHQRPVDGVDLGAPGGLDVLERRGAAELEPAAPLDPRPDICLLVRRCRPRKRRPRRRMRARPDSQAGSGANARRRWAMLVRIPEPSAGHP